jgi:hypothetical protein
VHGVLERILKGKLATDEKSISEAVKEKAEKLCGFSDADIARMKTDANKILNVWVKARLPEIEA